MLNISIQRAFSLRLALRPVVAFVAALGFMAPALADLKAVSVEVSKLYKNTTVSETIFKDLYRIDFGPNTAPKYVGESVSLILSTDGTKVTSWDQPVNKPAPISDEEKSGVLNAILRNIRFDKLIQIKQGKGSNQVLLLSAFDCPYCIQLERMLDSAGDKVDATFYILPSTLNRRDPARKENVHKLWCANDSAAAWRNALVKAPAQATGGATAPGCTWGADDYRDMYIVLNSMGVKNFGYPFMISDNGQPVGVELELPLLLKQLRNGSEKKFWSAQNRAIFPSTEYAQFRADKAGTRGWYP